MPLIGVIKQGDNLSIQGRLGVIKRIRPCVRILLVHRSRDLWYPDRSVWIRLCCYRLRVVSSCLDCVPVVRSARSVWIRLIQADPIQFYPLNFMFSPWLFHPLPSNFVPFTRKYIVHSDNPVASLFLHSSSHSLLLSGSFPPTN